MKNIFSFYSYKGNPEVGDTIVVPIDSAYKDDLPYWKDITQIVYQGALLQQV